MAFPVLREENAAQIRMSRETDAEKIENFALQPIGARPYRNKRIHDGIVSRQADAKPDSVAPGDGDQVIIQFEARLDGKTVDAGGIGKEVKLKGGVLAASLGGAAQQFARHDDGCFAAKLNDLGDGFWIPRAQMFDHNISALVGAVRHSVQRNSRKRRRGLLMPV